MVRCSRALVSKRRSALGDDLQVAYDRWHEWAIVQRDHLVGSKLGITTEEYETVAHRFAAVGIKPREP